MLACRNPAARYTACTIFHRSVLRLPGRGFHLFLTLYFSLSLALLLSFSLSLFLSRYISLCLAPGTIFRSCFSLALTGHISHQPPVPSGPFHLPHAVYFSSPSSLARSPCSLLLPRSGAVSQASNYFLSIFFCQLRFSFTFGSARDMIFGAIVDRGSRFTCDHGYRSGPSVYWWDAWHATSAV